MLKKNSLFFLLFTLLVLFTNTNCLSQEICTNGIDDDGDGLVDLHDPDCSCHFQVTDNLLQNGSFEFFKNCPVNYSYVSEYNIANFWQYGTYTNNNEADYYHNFSCPYDSSLVMLYIPPSLPLPNGKAFVSIRQYVYTKPQMKETDIAKVYVGQCLQTPLIPSEQYTLSFSAGKFKSNDDTSFKFKSEPFTVAIFGHPDCNAAPFGTPFANSNGCPSNYSGWILLGKKTIFSKGRWVENKINFTVPYNINLIEVGPDCSILNPPKDLTDSTTLLDFYVYYLDDIHLLPTKDFHFQYVSGDNVNTCTTDSILTVPYSPNTSYQWYKDSIAISGAMQNIFHLPANNRNGNYNVRITNNSTCITSEPFIIGVNNLSSLNLPIDTSFCEEDTLLLAPAINGISYSLNGHNISFVKISSEGNYTIIAHDFNGCSKTFNVAVHKDNCSTSHLFIPNSFTPNGDGKNDVFRIPREVKINVKSFTIFDGWGNKVYSSKSTGAEWDGRFNGKACSEGTYVYIIAGTINNREKRLTGTVFLLR